MRVRTKKGVLARAARCTQERLTPDITEHVRKSSVTPTDSRILKIF